MTLGMGVVLGGCNMGMAPSGGDSAQVIANFQKEDPQQQIRTIQSSPASPERKAQLIKDIEDKYHIQAQAPAPGSQAPGVQAPKGQ